MEGQGRCRLADIPFAPLYEPNEEEFKDPLDFINRIRPCAERFGICKIRPPLGWKPPFAINREEFLFTPRLQHLNELEAVNRSELNFIDTIAKFWDLQGNPIKLPNLEGKPLDISKLYRHVQQEGGFEEVCCKRKWSRISLKMGFKNSVGACLRTHYEKILYPYDLIKAGVLVEQVPRSKKFEAADSKKGEVVTQSSEKLGAGSKSVARYRRSGIRNIDTDLHLTKGDLSKPRTTHLIEETFCMVCNTDRQDDQLLLCDGCDAAYHTFCLIPALPSVPRGDWHCPTCVAEECLSANDQYGFEQAKRSYSIAEFGRMADDFKAKHFGVLDPKEVPYSTMEKRFWDLLQAKDEQVCVEYGADIHTAEKGSGFPTLKKYTDASDLDYATSWWNLNNLPVHEKSVLRHIDANISGMKVPWLYFGMCFSCFCWHIEDHWSYSVNYLHWGEAKTWYGIPSECADAFEQCIQSAAPDLFASHPDLLHHLVTILSPTHISDSGVNIYKVHQQEGEFVVTFPRAYHAGFNQGFNCAEAVNFCPMDWLPMGRGCTQHYKQMKRVPVFSHEELVFSLANIASHLSVDMAKTVLTELECINDAERFLRWEVTQKVGRSEELIFELLPDDERQCSLCRTTCFLSMVSCLNHPKLHTCLEHLEEGCTCPSSQKVLKFRYTDQFMAGIVEKVMMRAEAFNRWCASFHQLTQSEPKKDLQHLSSLVSDFEEGRFEHSLLLVQLKGAIKCAEEFASTVNQLLAPNSSSSETGNSTVPKSRKISSQQLEELINTIPRLLCTMPESAIVMDTKRRMDRLRASVNAFVSNIGTVPSAGEVESLLNAADSLEVEVAEVELLKQLQQKISWYERALDASRGGRKIELDLLKRLISEGEELCFLNGTAFLRHLDDLRSLLRAAMFWEEKAIAVTQWTRSRQTLGTIRSLVQEAESAHVILPSVDMLRTMCDRSTAWLETYHKLTGNNSVPFLFQVAELVQQSKDIIIRLDQVGILEQSIAVAKNWRYRLTKTVLRKKHPYTLLEAILPRVEASAKTFRKVRRRTSRSLVYADLEYTKIQLEQLCPLSRGQLHHQWEADAQSELGTFLSIRAENLEKSEIGDPRKFFCICHQPATAGMQRCFLCMDLYHPACVCMFRLHIAGDLSGKSAVVKNICPLCCRTRRPTLENIQAVIALSDQLSLRLLEADALLFLEKRFLAWRDRCRKFLLEPDIANIPRYLRQRCHSSLRDTVLCDGGELSVAYLLASMSAQTRPGPDAATTEAAAAGLVSSEQIGDVSPDSASPPDTGSAPVTSGELRLRGSHPTSSAQPPGIASVDTFRSHTSSPNPMAISEPDSSGTPDAQHGSEEFPVPASPDEHLDKPESSMLTLGASVEVSDLVSPAAELTCEETAPLDVVAAGDDTASPSTGLPPCLDSVESQAGTITRRGLFPDVPLLDSTLLSKLEELLVEGMLLEVSCPEINSVCQVYLSQFAPEKERFRLMDTKVRGRVKLLNPRKRVPAPDVQDTKLAGRRVPKKPRRLPPGRPSGVSRKPKGEEEDPCFMAHQCLRPMGDEVCWVQCDTCEGWYHVVCVGLSNVEAANVDKYHCPTCRGPSTTVVAAEQRSVLHRRRSTYKGSMDM